MDKKIFAVVVTYNRKELLKECIEALVSQTRKVDKIYIIDNNSTDDTDKYIYIYIGKNPDKNIKYIKLKENIGGAGGFYEGMKLAYQEGADWIWVMDDDTIPTKKALENLINAKSIINDKISFLYSSAWDSIEKHPLNHGKIALSTNSEGYISYRKYLEYGILELENATFVSCLINSDAVKKCGLPVKDYFIWGDDLEYTTRLTKYYGKGFQIGKSKVIHKRKGKIIHNIANEENENKLKFWFFMIRNSLITANAYERKKVMQLFVT